ncbi:MAG: S-layer homology domain-containing protein [Synergistaceae bacterium]|nr:S-layer homology domain-containing protein [Synergistaceae bacterium]
MRKSLKQKLFVILTGLFITAAALPAFAYSSPFADVPEGHWAYDAVAQLSARGLISGYPDGNMRGKQHATRYEIASVVARAVANLDAKKANETDMRALKRLVMEFHEELEALGVKVSEQNLRLTTLEDRVGGWRFSGSFNFDANWGNNDNTRVRDAERGITKNWFEFGEARLNLQKFLNDSGNEYVFIRMALDHDKNGVEANKLKFDRLFWRGQLGNDSWLQIGRFNIDWEGDSGLYHPGENDGWFNSFVADGFRAGAALGDKAGVEAVIARNIESERYPDADYDSEDVAFYALKLDGNFSEKFRAGLMGSWIKDDNDRIGGDANTYGAWFGWNVIPAASLKGVYYYQDTDRDTDHQDAWKIIADVKQEALGFSSFWFEYGQLDKNFFGTADNAYNWSNGYDSSIYKAGIADTKMLLVRADQKWNDAWGSFLRYAQADYDLDGADKVKNWTVGLNWQYTPAIGFQLAYDNIDYGNMFRSFKLTDEKDHIVRFRTIVNF